MTTRNNSAMFSNNDPFSSKLESFMDRKSRGSSRNAPGSRTNNNNRGLDPNGVISPRSDDGMSFISRKKHDDYANVVMEMKRKQKMGQGQQQVMQQQKNEWGEQQQQQKKSEWGEEEGWSDFGSNHFTSQPQQQQQQRRPQYLQPQQYSNQQQSQQQQRYTFNEPPPTKPERTGRKLYRPTNPNPTPSQHPSSSSSNNPIPTTRSRSTVRKTADLQRKLAQTYITSKQAKSNDPSFNATGYMEDDASEVGSVVSSVFLGNNKSSGSGSWGMDVNPSFGSFGSNSNSNASSFNNASSLNNDKKKKGLDALLDNNRKFATFSEESSVVSGTGSVAARRRAKAAFKNNAMLGHVAEDSSGVTAKHKHQAMLQIPPASSDARRNMRMRMQKINSNSSFSPQPKAQQFNAFQIDPNQIDDEVNNALNELKLDHPDIDFRFEPIGSSSVGTGSVDSSHSGDHRLKSQSSFVIMHNATNGSLESSPKIMLRKESKGRNSPVSTVGTKSMTVESSCDSNNNTATAQRHVVRSSSIGNNNNNNNSPLVPSTNKLIISPVISVEQYGESVERCSESSSLTDTSDWHVGSGGTSAAAGGTNMFKDATKGSTFHKSKRIVRVGESISENTTVDNPTSSKVSVEDGGIDVNSAMPSIKDRISQFKGSSGYKIYNSPGSSIKEEEPREKSSVYSSSSSNTIPTSTRSRSGLPPQVPTTSPFQVKLRKTKNILEEVADHTRDLENSSSSPAAAEASSSDGAEAKNPFLSNVKLRSTGTPSWKERQMSKQETIEQQQQQQQVERNDSHHLTEKTASPPPEPARKLTYREQQELLKQQQQEKETEPEEPKKNVAALIRERIAMNKQNNSIPPSPRSSTGSELDIGSLRGNLKKTSYGVRESITPTNSSTVGSETPSRPILSPQHVSTPKQRVYSPKEDEIESNPKQALNAMLAGRLGSPSIHHEEKKVESSPSDPRAALMASISKRNDPPSMDSPSDPRAALMAAISSKRASPPPSSEDEEEERPIGPKANLTAMLQNRIAASGGAASPAKAEVKNNLSAMLAKRAPPAETREVVEASANTDGKPTLKNDPKYEKYFKMLKVGMPLPAVQHAMTRDGLDPSVMEGDPNKPAPEPKPEGLPLKDDPIYAKYFKMLKLGLPMGAVKNAMERDGLDSSVMDGNHNLPASELTSCSPATKKKQKDTHRRTRLHWDTLVGKVKSNTVWALVNKDEELDNIVIDETEFTNLFQAEIKASSAPGEKSGSAARNVVQVIDPKRANNGGIILARLRMSYDDMAQAVERIDETAMTANQAQGIVEYMPTLDERKKLREYMKAGDGDSASKFDKLCECEKFMVAMMTVKQSKRKLRALLFKLQFRGCIHDLARDVFSIEKACDELSASVRLRKLFGIVLNIGNRLNTAGPGEKRKAGAFSIKSLLKLNQAKAFDNKTTFLHYVVLVVQRNSESLLDFKEDLPTALKADKIYWDQCVNELEEVETQLENVRKLAVHEAKASKVIYSLPNKSKQQEDNDSDELSVASISLEEEVALLRSTKVGMFALSAIKKVSQLRERVDIAKEKFCQLLEYFGEDSETSSIQPHELFEIISTFCRNFDAAREDVIKMEKAKKRDEKKKEENPQNADDMKQTIDSQRSPNPPRAPPPNKSPMLRSSSCQPNMSNVLADLKRATSKESSKREQLADSAPPTTSSAVKNPAPARNDPSLAQPKQSQSRDVPQLNSKYPSQLLNNEPPKTKYPEDEPITPERTSPVQSQQQSTPIATQKSSESEPGLAQASSSETCIKDEQQTSVSPRTTCMTRRDRRERFQSRSYAQSKTRSTPQTTAVSSSALPEPTLPEPTPQPDKPVPKASASPAASQSSARAAARDRYARHKKMMHQRKNTTS